VGEKTRSLPVPETTEKFITVKMLTLSAGVDGVRRPGDVISVPASEARQLIEGKYATPVAEPLATVRETASVPPAAEKREKPSEKPAADDWTGTDEEAEQDESDAETPEKPTTRGKKK
jgi:hypothetical protein